MSDSDRPRRRPPPFPQELLNRPKPRAVVEAERHINDTVDRVLTGHLLDVSAALQQRLSEAIGLIDAGKVADARAVLVEQVEVIDAATTNALDRG